MSQYNFVIIILSLITQYHLITDNILYLPDVIHLYIDNIADENKRIRWQKTFQLTINNLLHKFVVDNRPRRYFTSYASEDCLLWNVLYKFSKMF